MAGDLSEILSDNSSFAMTGNLPDMSRALFEALPSAFAGDEQAIILFVAFDKTRADIFKTVVEQLESGDLPMPQIQVTTPQILEQLMCVDPANFARMASFCRRYIVWMDERDCADNTCEYWFGILKELPANPAVAYMGLSLPQARLNEVHPDLKWLKYPVEQIGMRPNLWLFNPAQPEDIREFYDICRQKYSLVTCRNESIRLTYSEASHREHIHVVTASGNRPKNAKYFQYLSLNPVADFCLPDVEWSHCVFIDPLPNENFIERADCMLKQQNPVSVLATNRMAMLIAASNAEFPKQESQTQNFDVFGEIYRLYAALWCQRIDVTAFNTSTAKKCLDFWVAQGFVSIASGNVELTAAGTKLFPGIQIFSQLGILHGFKHDTVCKTINHEPVGLIESDFLRMNARFAMGGKCWQRQFHNILGNEVTLRMNQENIQPVWLDDMPVICSKHTCSAIESLLFSQTECSQINLSSVCREELHKLRTQFASAPAHLFIEVTSSCAHWWTFSGAKYNEFLAMILACIAPKLKVSFGNFNLRLSWDPIPSSYTPKIVARLREVVSSIHEICISGGSSALKNNLFQAWKKSHLYGWIFCLIPESVQKMLFENELTEWMKDSSQVEIPVFQTETLLHIDDDLFIAFEEKTDSNHCLSKTEKLEYSSQTAKCHESKTHASCSQNDTVAYRTTPVREGIMHTRFPWTYVDNEIKLAKALNVILSQKFIGLDVETTLYDQRLCLIQIGCADQTFLIDPLAVDISDLAQVFSHPDIIKVIHNSCFECQVLGKYGMPILNIVDTLKVSRRLHGMKCPGGHSLKAVCNREFGLDMDKENQTSRWEHRPLSLEQLEYAALDAEILVHLYNHFF